MQGEFLSNVSPELVFDADIDGSVMIGRNMQVMQSRAQSHEPGLPQAYYTVTDLTVSGVHCLVVRKEGQLALTDFGSKNGTVIRRNGNEEVVNRESRQIFAGDVIKIGASLELHLQIKNGKTVVTVQKKK